MTRLALLAAATVLSASAAAQVVAPRFARGMKIRPLGGYAWEPASSFKDRGMGWCENGAFVDAAVLPSRGEIRLVCSDYDDNTGKKFFFTQVLDADAKTVSQERFPDAGPLDAVHKEVGWLERGRAAPLPVTWDYSRLRVWNEKGGVVDIPVKDGVSGAALIGSKDGGPLIVVGHAYGENGLEAFRPNGKRAWSTADPADVRELSTARLDGRPVLAAWHSTSRLTFLDASGKVRERLSLGGNADRMLLDDVREPRLYTLDSKAGSSRETLLIQLGRKGKEGRRWESVASADLGPITITGYTLARFVPGAERRLVVGTSNGWVFLLDSSGKAVASRKFLSPVGSLSAADLDGDGRDELVVVIDGASENVVVFSPNIIP
ncbi:MAG: hypothetical protein HYV14_17550 [Elusimicrobia bacterium]|nr:hypothetical protein [Elusimicrobiota bacterium]